LEEAHVERLRRLIRGKKFRRYLIKKYYPIAIDGTQKLVRDGPWWNEPWLERRHEHAEGEQVQQYVYVLEANLAFHNGLSIPLMSEFLSYGEGDPDKAEILTKHACHVWISSEPLRWDTVHARCNLGARWRWGGIEDSMQTEKRRG
jgi:hypothetical protein